MALDFIYLSRGEVRLKIRQISIRRVDAHTVSLYWVFNLVLFVQINILKVVYFFQVDCVGGVNLIFSFLDPL